MNTFRPVISSLLLSAILLFGALAGAQTATPTPNATTIMRFQSAGGYSFFDAGTVGSGTTQTVLPTFYGGYTGLGGNCATAGPNVTCNSCDGAGLYACNQTSIHPGLKLSVTLVSSTAATFQGTPRLGYKIGTAASTPIYDTTGQSLTPGNPFTMQIDWFAMCLAAAGDVNCDNITTPIQLSIGIDNNNSGTFVEKVDFNVVVRYAAGGAGGAANTITTTCVGATDNTVPTEGICDYTVKRGDKKIYLQDIKASSTTLVTSNANVKYNRVIMFYSVDAPDATGIKNNFPNKILNLQLNDTSLPTIDDRRITGLQNGSKYCFALATIDQTGIISYFPKNAVLTDTRPDFNCATPEPVVGLLDDKHCFIATATFGSQMAPEVVVFREFRNKFLLTNAAGRAFVKAYYEYGPIGADWIYKSKTLKLASLGLLWPLLVFAKLSLALGLIPALLVIFLSGLALMQLLVIYRRTRATAP